MIQVILKCSEKLWYFLFGWLGPPEGSASQPNVVTVPFLSASESAVLSSKHPNTQASTHPPIQTSKHPNIHTSKASKHPNIHASKHPNTQTPKYPVCLEGCSAASQAELELCRINALLMCWLGVTVWVSCAVAGETLLLHPPPPNVSITCPQPPPPSAH